MPIKCEKCNETVEALPIHRCFMREQSTPKHDVLTDNDFAKLRLWARQIEGMREIFNDERAFQCEAVSNLLMSITTKRQAKNA